jgi:gliding motility-associated-like protein
MKRKLHHYNFPLLLILLCWIPLSQLSAQNPCECTNCPVPIQDNGTFDGFLDVTVNGPNNLGLCPLQRVCFTIDHTWVGDLSVSLISPSGLNYLVMADDNNNFGGCGNSNDNVNVCIEIGTGNPLTNNTPYMCNNGNPCLIGNWTVPCGGVTDPVGGAVQAPGCNLNAFNVPGNPANGTWTLRVNDICAADVGFLQTWSLEFACGTLSCITCDANGGNVNFGNVQGCQGSPSLNLNVMPTYPPPNNPVPPPASYSYRWVVTNSNGTIVQFLTTPNLTTLAPGTYTICGLSILTADLPGLNAYLNSSFAAFQSGLSNGTIPLCADLSNGCFNATIGPQIPPTITNLTLCLGDCYTNALGQQCCIPGPCTVTLQSYLGCDSVVTVNLTMIPPTQTPITQMVCPGECFTYNGASYCPPSTTPITLTSAQGCDSIILLSVMPVPVNAVIVPAPPITCSMPAVQLNAGFSTGNAFQWTNQNGQNVGTQSTLLVTQAGCYTVTVFNTVQGVTCSAQETFCVTANLALPGVLQLNGPGVVCLGGSAGYTVAVPDPNATSYVWTVSGGTIIAGGNGTLGATVNWTNPAGGQICVRGANACGLGPETCITVTLNTPPAAPSVDGPNEACPGDITTYTAMPVPAATSYSWTVPSGASILSGQGSTSISVNWGTSQGGNVCLVASNNCGNSPPACISVLIDEPPGLPVVSGPATVCPGSIVTYSISADPNATEYTWTIPACASLIDGQGSISITVEWPTGCSGGSICVIARDDCQDGPEGCLNVVVEIIPEAPAIDGLSGTCLGDVSTYSATPVAGASSYSWIVSGGDILSGQGTTQVDVSWTAGGVGNVCAVAVANCGNSPQTCMDVVVGDVATPPTISGLTVVCDGTVATYSVINDPNANDYNWTADCGTILNGNGTNSITVDWTGCPDGGEICLTIDSDCGLTGPICLPVQGGTAPDNPTITGTDISCQNFTELYCVDTDPNVSSFNWTVTGGSIQSGQGATCASILWTSAGTGQICVTAENGCGFSDEICFDVDLGAVPPAPQLSGPSSVCQNETAIFSIPLPPGPDILSYTWTTTCGDLISGQGTEQVEIQFTGNPGNCQVCATATNDCGEGTSFCINVQLRLYPSPNAGADSGICGLSYPLGATPSIGTGQWTVSGPGNAVFTNPASPTSNVTVNTFGDYTFTFTENNNGCIASDEVVVSFWELPGLEPGSLQEACTLDALFYSLSFSITGGQEPFDVTGTVGGTVSGNLFISELIPSGDSYSFTVLNANGCGPLEISGVNTCDCISLSGNMALDILEACEDGSVQAQAPGDALLDANDNFVFILHTGGDTLGLILDQNQTGIFSLIGGLMTPGDTYYISHVVGNDDGSGGVDLDDLCLAVSNGQPVIFHAYPNPNAGIDDAICGLQYTLAGQNDLGAHIWEAASGNPGMAVFTTPDAHSAEVQVDVFGLYEFVFSADNQGCVRQDTVVIRFDDAPVADNIGEVCNMLDFTYVVSFDIQGGLPPYQVIGGSGTTSGNSFSSDPIPAGQAYAFEVYDANGCGPFPVSGLVECPCTTEAGTMGVQLYEVCADGTVVVPASTNPQLDPEDILLYVLHNGDGASLGTEVYGYSPVPEFSLIPPMQVGVTYYVSALAGNDLDGDGVIDSNDPCVDVAPGTPVRFTALPVVGFAGDVTVCEGQTASLILSIQAESCVDLEYILSDGSTGTLSCVSDWDALNIPAQTSNLTITLTSITDQSGCVGQVGASAVVNVNLIPQATLASGASVCNSTDSGSSTLLDFSSLILSGDTNGSWANTNNAQVSGTLPVLNFNGAIPGVYTFTYTTGSAQAPCPNPSFDIEVVVEDCVCPPIALTTPADLCNTTPSFNLNQLQQSAAPGTWTISSTPGGGNPATLSGAVLNTLNADPGLYTLSFTLNTNPPVGCPNSDAVTLQLNEALTAGQGSSQGLCAGEILTINLNNLLQGADPGGIWTEVSALPSAGGAFQPVAGTFNTLGQAAQTYQFRYTITPQAPCAPDVSLVTVIIHPLPVADAGSDQTLTCIEPQLVIGGNSSSGASFSYLWSSTDGAAFPGDSSIANPELSQPGTFQLEVINMLTGCRSTDEVTLQTSQEVPVPVISIVPISCFGRNDGAIVIESVSGSVSPYLYSFNGGAFSSGSQITGLSPAIYTVQIEGANGCQTEVISINITQPQELNVQLVAVLEGDNEIILGDSILLQAVVNIPEEDIDQVIWSPADVISCDTCLISWANPLQSTNFSVTVGSNGCTDSDRLTIGVRKIRPVYVPNVFSPNADGVNDVFHVFAGPQVALIRAFLVFDRWGETMHQYYNIPPNDPAYGWDGTYKGKVMNPQVLVWYIEVEFTDGSVEIMKGDVTLMR